MKYNSIILSQFYKYFNNILNTVYNSNKTVNLNPKMMTCLSSCFHSHTLSHNIVIFFIWILDNHFWSFFSRDSINLENNVGKSGGRAEDFCSTLLSQCCLESIMHFYWDNFVNWQQWQLFLLFKVRLAHLSWIVSKSLDVLVALHCISSLL